MKKSTRNRRETCSCRQRPDLAVAAAGLLPVQPAPKRFWGLTRTEWICAAVLLAISFGMFWKGFVDPADMCREDAGYMVHPMYEYAAAEIRAGRFPHWDPYTAMGISFHAGFIGSVMYPLRWPLFFMPYENGYAVNLWVHHFLTAFIMFLFLRRVIKCSELPAMIGAVSFTYCGFSMGHATHAPYFMAYPWFVLAIMLFVQAMQKESGAHAMGAAVAVGLMGLAGAVQPVMVLGLGLAFWAIAESAVRLVQRLRGLPLSWMNVAVPVMAVAIVMGVGAMIAAAQFWPSYQQGNVSVRGHKNWAYITEMSLHPTRSVIQLVAPFYYGNCSIAWWGEGNWQDQSKYVGIIPLILAVLAAVWRWRESWTIRFVIITLLAGAIATGKHGPVYRFFYEYMPMFDRLRNPARLFVWGEFGLACLAAMGAQRLMDCDKPRIPKGVAWTVSGVALLCLGLLAWCWLDLNAISASPALAAERADGLIEKALKIYSDRAKDAVRVGGEIMSGRYVWPWFQAAVGGASAILMGVAILLRRPLNRAWMAAILGVAVLDLAMFSSSAIMYSTTANEMVKTVSPTVTFLQENLGLSRYLCLLGPTEETNRFRGMLHRIRSASCNEVGTFFTPEQYAYVKLNHAVYRESWDLCGVKYIVADQFIDEAIPSLTGFRHAMKDGPRCVTENLNMLPRAFLARQVMLADDPNNVYGLLLGSGATAFADLAAVDENMESLPDVSKNSPKPREPVEIEPVTPSRLIMKTSSDGPRQLVFTEAYHPEWRCNVDGQPTPIYRTDAAFMSVRVQSGEHTVEWWYEPTWFYQGLTVTGSSLLFVLAVFYQARLRQRRTVALAGTEPVESPPQKPA